MSKPAKAMNADEAVDAQSALDEGGIEGHREISSAELKSISEALIFVADEPLSAKTIADVIDVDRDEVEKAIADVEEQTAQFQSNSDKELYDSNPQVRSICDELATMTRFQLVELAIDVSFGQVEHLGHLGGAQAAAFEQQFK